MAGAGAWEGEIGGPAGRGTTGSVDGRSNVTTVSRMAAAVASAARAGTAQPRTLTRTQGAEPRAADL